MKARTFSLLLALLFIFSLLPVFAVSAAEEIEEQTEEFITADISDRVIQAGGMPVRTEKKRSDNGNFAAAIAAIADGISRRETSIYIEDYAVPLSELETCYEGAINSHPEFFFVDTNYRYLPSNDGIHVELIKPTYNAAYDEDDTAQFASVCEAILAGLPEGTAEEKLLYIHDYIVTHCQYDLTYSKFNAYQCLVEGSAVCQGYTLAFLHLCNLAGFNAEFISSKSLVHSWNAVEIGGEHYYVDCTWDDPITTVNGLEKHCIPSYCSHKHFLGNWEDCKNTHDSTDWVNTMGQDVYSGYTSTDTYNIDWWNDLRDYVQRPVQWIDNQMYYTMTNDSRYIYRIDSGLTGKTTIEIRNPPAIWHVFNDPSRYYTSFYITAAVLNGEIYYSTPTEIWKISADGSFHRINTLTAVELAKGYIYGIQAIGERLVYHLAVIATNPCTFSGTLNVSDLPELFTVVFDSNGGEGTMAVQSAPANTTVTLEPNAFSWEDYVFSGWNTEYDGSGVAYDDGTDVTLTSDLTLYAQWTPYVPEYIDSGVCSADGNNLIWALDNDYVLSIRGNGDMAIFSSEEEIPWVFYRNKIVSVVISSGVSSIGDRAFYNCSCLTSITIPESITSIGRMAFLGCSELTAITIPSNAVEIGYAAFSSCSKLTSVTIPEGVTSINDYTYLYCDSLASITLPASVSGIGEGAFAGCTSLNTINYGGTQGQWADVEIGSDNAPLLNAAFHCMQSSLSICYTEKALKSGKSFQFNATGGSGFYTWRTGNTLIATVDASGKVTGMTAGNTYLYCTDSYGDEVKCLLKVVIEPLSIRYSEKTVTVGVPFQFSATGGSGIYTWRTGNAAKATVDTTGKVTGVSAGNTYLYCKDSSGTEVKCLLKIVASPLSIRYVSKTVSVGASFQFEATGGTGSYTWRVGNTATATVDSTGKVTGKAAGNTYLYCKDSGGAEVKCLLKVVAPLSIRYSEKTVTVGVPFQFEATGGTGSYTWRTGNTAKATVDTTGKVTGVSAGNTYLYCKDSAGTEVKCLLKVVVPLSIRYSEKTISVGVSFQFEATGGTGGYTWRVGNTDKATVESTGRVTGISAGNTYLYCRDSYGNEVKCLLKIKA